MYTISPDYIAMFIFICSPIIFLLLAIECSIASKFTKIATSKGHKNKISVWLLCFFFGFVGYLYVLALPDLTLRVQNQQILSLLIANRSGSSLGTSYTYSAPAPKKKF